MTPRRAEPDVVSRRLRLMEESLRDLQLQLTRALRQKERLAALGGAVAKISHDLRNLLTTAQLLADRIESSADPAVRRTAPKLVASLDRAISLDIVRLLDRINRTGTTIVMATHDHDIVNEMRRRVLQLSDGIVVRDQDDANYHAPEA